MAQFKVVQVIKDHPLYDWVSPRLQGAGIDYQERLCRDKYELAHCAADADLVWSYGGGGPPGLFEAENLAKLKRCGAILRTGSGVDDIDLEKATELGIIVANTPQVVAEAVSDHTIALLFATTRQIGCQDRRVRAGEWHPKKAKPGRLLAGATLGLVGFGHIPRRLVQRLSGFELNILVYDPYVGVEEIRAYGAAAVALDELLQSADFVSLHCPLTEATQHLIGERELKLMRPHALLINTSRGPVVDEMALTCALKQGWIAGAALDVLEKEPPDKDNPLFGLENVVITPHMGGYDASYPHLFIEASIEAILDLSERRWPYSVVNPQVKPRWEDMPLCTGQ